MSNKEKLVLVIENGQQILYTESGERINRVYDTVVFQNCNPGRAYVLAGVNIDTSGVKTHLPSCKYEGGKLLSPNGAELDVLIREYEKEDDIWANCYFCAHVLLKYETKHKENA